MPNPLDRSSTITLRDLASVTGGVMRPNPPPCQPPPCQPPPCHPQPPTHCGWPFGNPGQRVPYQLPNYSWWNHGRTWQNATGTGNASR
jgi:CubicO group peptidase (beta-lactamase class C family)